MNSKYELFSNTSVTSKTFQILKRDNLKVMTREHEMSYAENVRFIKVVSDIVFDMINAVNYDKPLISIGAMC